MPVCTSNLATVVVGAGRHLGRTLGWFVGLLVVLGAIAAPPSKPPVTEYRIQPSDLLDINVYREADLCLKVRVNQTGSISYPLLGSIAVVGLTAAEVQDKLTAMLGKDYLVAPRVTVAVEASSAQRVIIIGQVKMPGSYDIPANETLTILQLIARAGGFTDLAAQSKITVIRGEGSKQKKILVNISDIIRSGDKNKDIALEPGDIVSVPETLF
jgi:polysaccharide export outer membrane protein